MGTPSYGGDQSPDRAGARIDGSRRLSMKFIPAHFRIQMATASVTCRAPLHAYRISPGSASMRCGYRRSSSRRWLISATIFPTIPESIRYQILVAPNFFRGSGSFVPAVRWTYRDHPPLIGRRAWRRKRAPSIRPASSRRGGGQTQSLKPGGHCGRKLAITLGISALFALTWRNVVGTYATLYGRR